MAEASILGGLVGMAGLFGNAVGVLAAETAQQPSLVPYLAGGGGTAAAVGACVYFAKKVFNGEMIHRDADAQVKALTKIVEDYHSDRVRADETLKQLSSVIADNTKVLRSVERRRPGR